MKTKQLTLLLFIVIVTTSAIAQDKWVTRHVLSFSVTGNAPLLSGFFKDVNYVEKNSEMVDKRDWLDYGASFQYTTSLSKRFSFGIGVDFNRFQIANDRKYATLFKRQEFSHSDTIYLKAQSVRVNTFSFFPVFEFQNPNSTGSVGLYYSFGFGYTMSKLQKGNYSYSLAFKEDSENFSEVDTYKLENDWKPISGAKILLGLGMRTALTKNLLLDFGIKYNINFFFKPDESDLNTLRNDLISLDSFYYNMKRDQLFKIEAKIGLVLAI